MQYDPIKRTLGTWFGRWPWLRRLFYVLLDLLLLRAWHIRRELRALPHKAGGRDILDAGAGFGQYTWRLAQDDKGARITAVDLKTEQVADCNTFFACEGLAGRVHFEVADLTTFVREEAYDLVLSVDVMEHIERDEAVFGNFCRSLRSGGVLLISTPSDLGGSDAEHGKEEGEGNQEHPVGEHSTAVRGFIDEHVRDGYNALDIADKLRRGGFESVVVKYSYGPPGHLAWLLTMKLPILALGASKLCFLLLIPYYIVVYPPCFVLNLLDVLLTHRSGTGLIVRAQKP